MAATYRKRRLVIVAPVDGDGVPIAPPGFILLVDTDGAYLVDSDGAFLMEAI